MLYEYEGKIYVKLYENKIVEVIVKKIANGYDVEPTNKVVIDDGLYKKIQSISVEEAYKLTSAKKSLKDKDEF